MNCNTNHHTIQSVAPKKTTTLLALSSVSIGTANAFETSDPVQTNNTTHEGPSKEVSKTVFGKMAPIAIAMLVIGCCFSVKDHFLIVQNNNNANADAQADVSRGMKIDVQRETDKASETAEEEAIIGGEKEPIDLKSIIDALEKSPKDEKNITFSSLLPANAATLPKNH
eukprot:458654_1